MTKLRLEISGKCRVWIDNKRVKPVRTDRISQSFEIEFQSKIHIKVERKCLLNSPVWFLKTFDFFMLLGIAFGTHYEYGMGGFCPCIEFDVLATKIDTYVEIDEIKKEEPLYLLGYVPRWYYSLKIRNHSSMIKSVKTVGLTAEYRIKWAITHGAVPYGLVMFSAKGLLGQLSSDPKSCIFDLLFLLYFTIVTAKICFFDRNLRHS